MARDKLITIRIESSKREAFKNWAESRNIDVSSFLYDVVDACLDGRITEKILTESGIDNVRVNNLDNRIDALDKRLAQLDSSIDEKIDHLLATNRNNQIDTKLDDKLNNIDKRIDEARSVRQDWVKDAIDTNLEPVKQELDVLRDRISQFEKIKSSTGVITEFISRFSQIEKELHNLREAVSGTRNKIQETLDETRSRYTSIGKQVQPLFDLPEEIEQIKARLGE